MPRCVQSRPRIRPRRGASASDRWRFRREILNALNRANFSTPATTIFDDRGTLTANVGVITATRTSARQMQLGVKLLW